MIWCLCSTPLISVRRPGIIHLGQDGKDGKAEPKRTIVRNASHI